MIDLRTKLQKKRDKRADEVVEIFISLKDTEGSMNAKLNYISNVLKRKGRPITVMGIKGILKRRELYNMN